MPIQQMFLGAGAEGYAGDSQEAFYTAGTYSWTVPVGVESVSVACIGGGGAGGRKGTAVTDGGGGGACAYKNNISVTPGSSITVVVGAQGITGAEDGGDSYFLNTSTVKAVGGQGPDDSGRSGGASGSCVGDGAYSGGDGSNGSGGQGGQGSGSNGGNGTAYNAGTPAGGTAGNGGGGGGSDGPLWNETGAVAVNNPGGAKSNTGAFIGAGGGGGNGAGDGSASGGQGGGGGGGGSLGQTSSGPTGGGAGNNTTWMGLRWFFGGQLSGNGKSGGGGGSYGTANTGMYTNYGYGAAGGVRIIWPGNTRQFPSTNIGDV